MKKNFFLVLFTVLLTVQGCVNKEPISASKQSPQSSPLATDGKDVVFHAILEEESKVAAFAVVDDYPGAIKQLQTSLKSWPGSVELTTSLARFYKKSGDLASAKRLYVEVENMPDTDRYGQSTERGKMAAEAYLEEIREIEKGQGK